VLAVARIGVADPDRFIAEHGLQSAVESLREVGLLAQDSIRPSSLSPGWAFQPLYDAAAEYTETNDIADVGETVRTEEGRDALVEAAIDSGGFASGWLDFVLEELPEVAAFTEWFDRDTTGEVGFRSYEGLVAEVGAKGLQTRKAFSIRSWPSVDSQELSLKNTYSSSHHTGSTGAVSAGHSQEQPVS